MGESQSALAVEMHEKLMDEMDFLDYMDLCELMIQDALEFKQFACDEPINSSVIKRCKRCEHL